MFIIGQRWISESEPELGLGTIAHAGDGRVQVAFAAAGETRVYTAEQAPLQRVRFRVGEKIRPQTGA
jgi:ATP-dependent helicase HepA